MMRSLYKKIDRQTTAWDLDSGSSRYVNNATLSRRKLKHTLRKMARKKIKALKF